jgi:hypothetical protein
MEEDGIKLKVIDVDRTTLGEDRFQLLKLKERKKFFFAMLFSFIGGALLVSQDFGGWTYRYNPYGTNPYASYPYSQQHSVTINIFDEPVLGLAIIALSVLLFACTYIAFIGFMGKTFLSIRTITIGFLLALMVFVAVNFGAYQLISGQGQHTAWLGPGYIGGAGGSLIVMILFALILMRRR